MKAAPTDRDYSRVVSFLSDAKNSEDDKYLATLWLDKFVDYRDNHPPRDDRNKRGSKPVDRYVPPSVGESPLKLVKNRAPKLPKHQSRTIDATESSLQLPTSIQGKESTKPNTPGLVLTEKIISAWNKRFSIAFNQLHAVQDGDQNRLVS